jgi:hypothetical protein
MPMDQIGLPLPCHAHKTFAGNTTQSNESLFKGVRISVNRTVRRVRSFFASRANGSARSQGDRNRLQISRHDAVPANTSNISQLTSSTPWTSLPLIQAPASRIYSAQDRQEKKEQIIHFFTKKLAIAIQEAGKQCEQAISALELPFPERKEVPPDAGESPFLAVPMPEVGRPKMIENAQKIFNDFQNDFPKYGVPCKNEADIAQMLWMTLHSMQFQVNTIQTAQFEKIMQDSRNNIFELLLLNIAGKKSACSQGIFLAKRSTVSTAHVFKRRGKMHYLLS